MGEREERAGACGCHLKKAKFGPKFWMVLSVMMSGYQKKGSYDHRAKKERTRQ